MALAEMLIYLSIKSDLRNSNSLKMKTIAQNKENLTNIYHGKWNSNKWIFHINQTKSKENNKNVSIRHVLSTKSNDLFSMKLNESLYYSQCETV